MIDKGQWREFGQDTGVTPLLFTRSAMGFLMTTEMIQKTNIDTLHKEGKSQRVITERCGCLQSAVSKHIKCTVDWKEEFG